MASGDTSCGYAGSRQLEASGVGDEGAVESSGQAAPTAAYLDELVRDARALDHIVEQPSAPGELRHVRRVLMQEVSRVWSALYSRSAGDAPLPAVTLVCASTLDELSFGRQVVSLSETVAVPNDQYPGYNFIGRLLGPRGMSVKQLEQVTGCKILVRGRGSVKDAEREARLSTAPGWEHLTQPLHVLVTADDERWRAVRKLQAAVGAVRHLLAPVHTDDYKRRQLVQLAIINGTYRPGDQQPF